MKKLLLPVIAGLTSLGLIACSGDEEAATQEESATQEEQAAEMQQQQEEIQAKMEEQKLAEDEVVATVNGEEILGAEYNVVLETSQMQYLQFGQDPTEGELAEELKTQTIDNLVGNRLILQAADEEGITADEAAVDEQMETTKSNFESDEAYQTALEESNLTEDELREQLKDSIIFNSYIEQTIEVEEPSDEEIQTFYDENVVPQAEQMEQEPQPLEEVRDQIVDQLTNQERSTKLVDHVEELKSNGEVEINI